MYVDAILESLRDGAIQSDEAIQAFVDGVVDGSWSRPQVAAWLAWAYARELTPPEMRALTRAMTHSGEVLHWGEGPPLVDKHSTGGVGDKISLVLAPLWASLGFRVPMLSGRGLGHTGGTLDKLEAIPGFRTDLDRAALGRILDEAGAFVAGQTEALAPADRVLYALRDEIRAVPSIPLIVGSILSKKLAEGTERLVLDVKCGQGAFMKTRPRAEALARALVEVGAASGVACRALVTAMEEPLGVAVGNALEVAESVAILEGGGPPEVRALVVALSCVEGAEAALDDGRAREAFARMVEAQGGDPRALDDPSRLSGVSGLTRETVEATRAGVVQRVDALALGHAAFRLGAGRSRAGAPVDPGVGLEVPVRVGDRVEAGQPLVVLHHRDGHALEAARAHVLEGITLGDAPVDPGPLVLGHVGPEAPWSVPTGG